MKNIPNKYKIDWDDEDNKKASEDSTVNRIIVQLFRESYPDVVKKIEKLVRDRLEDT